MKLTAAALAAVSLAMTAAAATPAMAQYGWRGGYGPGPYYNPYDGPRYGAPEPYYAPGPYSGAYDEPGIPRYEVMAIVRAANLRPVSRPWRSGSTYIVQALDLRGQPVRVMVDAMSARIVSIRAATGPAPTAGSGAPDTRVGALRPESSNGDDVPPPPRPIPNAQRPAKERTAAVTPAHTPMPRPRPADAPVPAAVKPAPDAPPAPPAAASTPPAPQETPAAAPPAEPPRESTGAAPAPQSFPPIAPLE